MIFKLISHSMLIALTPEEIDNSDDETENIDSKKDLSRQWRRGNGKYGYWWWVISTGDKV